MTCGCFSGKTGIRTLGTRKGTTVFETVPIDHSGIFPLRFARAKLRIFSQTTLIYGEVFFVPGSFFGEKAIAL